MFVVLSFVLVEVLPILYVLDQNFMDVFSQKALLAEGTLEPLYEPEKAPMSLMSLNSYKNNDAIIERSGVHPSMNHY